MENIIEIILSYLISTLLGTVLLFIKFIFMKGRFRNGRNN